VGPTGAGSDAPSAHARLGTPSTSGAPPAGTPSSHSASGDPKAPKLKPINYPMRIQRLQALVAVRKVYRNLIR